MSAITRFVPASPPLNNGGMAAPESPRTTKLYDRTGDEITLDEVEKISPAGEPAIRITCGP